MPIGAIIGGVASIGGALLSSKSNKKAINTATQAQQQSDAAQIALQREIYGQNQAALSPFMTRGNLAGDTIMAALGLGGSVSAPAAPAGAATANGALTPFYSDPSANPMGGNYGGYQGWLGAQMGARDMPAGWNGSYGLPNNPSLSPAVVGPAAQTAAQPAAQPAGQTPQQAATSAYELFKQSTGYQTRLQEGQRSQGALYGAAGVYQSGARDKALARFNQDYASGEFGNWLGYLGNQQGVGLAGASALAGVGQGFADRMGAISQNGANVASQAAIARAQNQGALWTGIAGGIGGIAGALSSYRA